MNARRPALILGFTLLVVMTGYGMVLPVMPYYIVRLGAGGREMGWLMSSYSLMQLICAPLWGILSDRVGRKPILTIGIFGYALTLFLFGLADTLWMLVLARTLSGVLSSATMPTAMAYVGDNSSEADRSRSMGQLGAAMGLGVILGPLIGGLLARGSLALPFFAGSALAFTAFLLVITILPESRSAQPVERRERLTRAALLGLARGPAGALLLAVFLMSFGLSNFQGISGLYVVDKFQATPSQTGVIWMVMGAVMAAAQGLLIGPLTRRLGEPRLIFGGLTGGALGFVLIALAWNFASVLAAIAFFSLALAVMGPALNAHLSRLAGGRQGALMGINSAATSLGRVIGPLWAGPLYDSGMNYPFYSGALTLLVGLLVCVTGLRGTAASIRPGARPVG